MLEEAGANLNSVTEKGYSVLSYAIKSYDFSPNNNQSGIDPVVEYLLTKTSIGEEFLSFTTKLRVM